MIQYNIKYEDWRGQKLSTYVFADDYKAAVANAYHIQGLIEIIGIWEAEN